MDMGQAVDVLARGVKTCGCPPVWDSSAMSCMERLVTYSREYRNTTALMEMLMITRNRIAEHDFFYEATASSDHLPYSFLCFLYGHHKQIHAMRAMRLFFVKETVYWRSMYDLYSVCMPPPTIKLSRICKRAQQMGEYQSPSIPLFQWLTIYKVSMAF